MKSYLTGYQQQNITGIVNIAPRDLDVNAIGEHWNRVYSRRTDLGWKPKLVNTTWCTVKKAQETVINGAVEKKNWKCVHTRGKASAPQSPMASHERWQQIAGITNTNPAPVNKGRWPLTSSSDEEQKKSMKWSDGDELINNTLALYDYLVDKHRHRREHI